MTFQTIIDQMLSSLDWPNKWHVDGSSSRSECKKPSACAGIDQQRISFSDGWQLRLFMLRCVALFCCALASGRLNADEQIEGTQRGQLPPASETPVEFSEDIEPILRAACFSCHGPERQRSGLRLDRRSAAFKGGDLGVSLVPGKSHESRLIQYVAGMDPELRMPPEGDPLTPKQVGLLRRWIDDGAEWPDSAANEPDHAAEDWWSLRELDRPPVPEIASGQSWIRTPVDAFILDLLQKNSLGPSPEADRRTLIRRLTCDLHGLQPTPDEVDAFVKDARPDACEILVDRLLESPRYGERWARHWLDVVHYADSHGHDQDRPRENAWPYRDYLIRALNDDIPYSAFVKQQVAGDILSPDDPLSITATGFLAAGPWDESSLQSIREDSIDRLIGQNLDRDDIVSSTMSTFTGLTVGCARCHDHKFDPITQRDYYSLQAVFAGIDKAERLFDATPQTAAERRSLQQQLQTLNQWMSMPLEQILTPERQAALLAFENSRRSSESLWSVPEPLRWAASQGSILKALLDRSILAVGQRPEKDTYSLSVKAPFTTVTAVRLELLTDDTLPMNGPGRQDNGNLHLSEIRVQVHPEDDPAKVRPVVIRDATADFSQADWGIEKSFDGNNSTAWGIHPEVGRSHSAVFEFASPVVLDENSVLTVVLDQLHGTGHLIGRFRISVTNASSLGPQIQAAPQHIAAALDVPADMRSEEQQKAILVWLEERRLKQALAALPPLQRVYCGTSQFEANGTFRPASAPRKVYVLTRGDINRPGDEAAPGALNVLNPAVPSIDLPNTHSEGERRAALARWLTDARNPLTWRVIVNRVWHYHFGRGICDTPNDLGRMGGTPSHPELLNWLAADFRDSGGSLKQLHRLLLTSSVYRQSSELNEEAALKDSDNRLLWRMNRQRLDAETIRDSLMQVSGQMDLTMYGSPAKQFLMSAPLHVTPNADYLRFDVDSAESRRRSIYRFIFRTLPDPWLEALDCPDASQSAPARGDSGGALQALALWNNKFTLRQCEHLAELAGRHTTDSSAQIDFVSRRILLRPPAPSELAEWQAYVSQFGLPGLCRVLLNSSEFLFAD